MHCVQGNLDGLLGALKMFGLPCLAGRCCVAGPVPKVDKLAVSCIEQASSTQHHSRQTHTY